MLDLPDWWPAALFFLGIGLLILSLWLVGQANQLNGETKLSLEQWELHSRPESDHLVAIAHNLGMIGNITDRLRVVLNELDPFDEDPELQPLRELTEMIDRLVDGMRHDGKTFIPRNQQERRVGDQWN